MSETMLRAEIAEQILKYRDSSRLGVLDQLEETDGLVLEQSIDLEMYDKYAFEMLTEVAEAIRTGGTL